MNYKIFPKKKNYKIESGDYEMNLMINLSVHIV